MIRSCFRCGRTFEAFGARRVCEDCKVLRRPPSDPRGQALTVRERQIVSLIERGKLNKQIAFDLHLTEGTIKEYLQQIFKKTGVSNRTELAVWSLASRHGIAA